ncbi:transposase family protein [Streptomyces sp. NPDC058548]|uniref:transposase family protein n=1 Tax=unclassified Streptomyces TaxID=2593676 RepID=UPI0036681808
MEIRVRRPAARRQDRGSVISGKNKQNVVKSMVVTDVKGRVLWCSPTKPGSCANITHAPQPGLVKLLTDGPAVGILADVKTIGFLSETPSDAARHPATGPGVGLTAWNPMARRQAHGDGGAPSPMGQRATVSDCPRCSLVDRSQSEGAHPRSPVGTRFSGAGWVLTSERERRESCRS